MSTPDEHTHQWVSRWFSLSPPLLIPIGIFLHSFSHAPPQCSLHTSTQRSGFAWWRRWDIPSLQWILLFMWVCVCGCHQRKKKFHCGCVCCIQKGCGGIHVFSLLTTSLCLCLSVRIHVHSLLLSLHPYFFSHLIHITISEIPRVWADTGLTTKPTSSASDLWEMRGGCSPD